MHEIAFTKMHGSGNHFVLLDNRSLRVPVPDMARWAEAICAQGFGVGADGLIFLDAAPAGSDADYMWHFYNADGSRAEMCGNGSRCAARLAMELGLAGPEHVLLTDAGPIRALVDPDSDQVKVQLTKPRDLALDVALTLEGQRLTVHFVNTGVPHTVVECGDVAGVDVKQLGRALRFHERFAPAGTNVNFISVTDRNALSLRTYERGVEDETYACGTGAAASALVAHALGLAGTAAAVTTSGGEVLRIFLENGTVHLQGPAVTVYSGRLRAASVGLDLPAGAAGTDA
ncbi:MAG: diaminopimelate epimerase [Thermodesulfobacteriota bacterium]